MILMINVVELKELVPTRDDSTYLFVTGDSYFPNILTQLDARLSVYLR